MRVRVRVRALPIPISTVVTSSRSVIIADGLHAASIEMQVEHILPLKG